MIELHKLHNDRRSDEIEERLREMVVAFRVHTWPANPARSANSQGSKIGDQTENNPTPPNAPLPCIREGDAVISSEEELVKYLDELEYFMNIQKSISSDACFIDPRTGKIC